MRWVLALWAFHFLLLAVKVSFNWLSSIGPAEVGICEPRSRNAKSAWQRRCTQQRASEWPKMPGGNEFWLQDVMLDLHLYSCLDWLLSFFTLNLYPSLLAHFQAFFPAFALELQVGWALVGIAGLPSKQQKVHLARTLTGFFDSESQSPVIFKMKIGRHYIHEINTLY